MIVLDTNIVLDLLVFNDAAAQPLKQALAQRKQRWLATAAMREELERVLGYPKIHQQLNKYRLDAAEVLAQFGRQAHIVEEASRSPVSCSDPDDQKFIDLAVAYQALLISKDEAVLRLAGPLAALGVDVRSVMAL